MKQRQPVTKTDEELRVKMPYKDKHKDSSWHKNPMRTIRKLIGTPKPTLIIVNDVLTARCPKCGRLIELRVCQSCKNVMCYDCLVEHHVKCLYT